MDPIVSLKNLSHTYPAKSKVAARQALRGVSFDVAPGQTFGVLGPNGGGKSTLFKILATSFLPTSGEALLFGMDLIKSAKAIRSRLGVVFQHPSLDAKLTVRENMMHHGHLYGLRGSELSKRMNEMMERYGLTDRANDLAGTLSGGLKRRVELAKGLLHKPELILLDEPSTGLDPGARQDLWRHLRDLKAGQNVTILVTTHYMDEAENCDRLVLLDEGVMAAQGSPQALKSEIGADVITIEAKEPQALCDAINQRFSISAKSFNGTVRLEREKGHTFIPQLVEAFPGGIQSISLSKPTLEDVFLRHTGHKFWAAAEEKKKS